MAVGGGVLLGPASQLLGEECGKPPPLRALPIPYRKPHPAQLPPRDRMAQAGSGHSRSPAHRMEVTAAAVWEAED